MHVMTSVWSATDPIQETKLFFRLFEGRWRCSPDSMPAGDLCGDTSPLSLELTTTCTGLWRHTVTTRGQGARPEQRAWLGLLVQPAAWAVAKAGNKEPPIPLFSSSLQAE